MTSHDFFDFTRRSVSVLRVGHPSRVQAKLKEKTKNRILGCSLVKKTVMVWKASDRRQYFLLLPFAFHASFGLNPSMEIDGRVFFIQKWRSFDRCLAEKKNTASR